MIYINEYFDFSKALAVRNIGTQLTAYVDQMVLPFEIDFTMSQTLENVPIVGT